MLPALLGILVPVLLVLYAFRLVAPSRPRVRVTRIHRTEIEHRRAAWETPLVRAERRRREEHLMPEGR